jgi:Protein of unknown function (DUF1573)
MCNKGIKMLALVAILSLSSCKQKEEFQEQQIDGKTNQVLPPGQLAMKDNTMKKKLKPEEYPVIQFDNANHNFGDIKEGDKVTHVFKFKNTGKNDLTVIEVRPSCGCTAPEWTRTPVKSGESGEIKIIFDSNRKVGQNKKSIALLTNTMEGNEVLTFEANVISNGKNDKSPLNTTKK